MAKKAAAAARTGKGADGVTFFKRPADLRKWLAAHHATANELWIGFYKKASGEPSITWPESVDEALCVGWIDGVRKRIDEDRYKIRFSPRRKGSIWSAVNVARVAVLTKEKRMQPAGLAAFAEKRENRSGIYAYEQRPADLPEPYSGVLQRNKPAYAFYIAQPPSYRKLMAWYIVSAKKEETRTMRLDRVIAACEAGRRL